MRSFLLIALFSANLAVSAQGLFRGLGVFGSVTSNRHVYRNADTDKKDTSYFFPHFYPQTHISKEFISWGAGIFAEFSRRSDFVWQTELEYINKGAQERGFLALGVIPYTDERVPAYSVNRTTYIQWNNYAKKFFPIFFEARWYVMGGVRLEYLFRNTPTVFADAVSSFPKFWFSPDLGLGYEFPLVRKLHVFLEYHWNPDLLPIKYQNTNIRRRTHELRLGIIYRPRKRNIDDCNAPVYKGPGN